MDTKPTTMKTARRFFKAIPPTDRAPGLSFRGWARRTYDAGACTGKLARLLDHARGRGGKRG